MRRSDTESGISLADCVEKSILEWPPLNSGGESEPLQGMKNWVRLFLQCCLCWSSEQAAPVLRIAVAGLGMAVPVAVGACAGLSGRGHAFRHGRPGSQWCRWRFYKARAIVEPGIYYAVGKCRHADGGQPVRPGSFGGGCLSGHCGRCRPCRQHRPAHGSGNAPF